MTGTSANGGPPPPVDRGQGSDSLLDNSVPLSAGERAFLLQYTDLTEQDLTPEARAATAAVVAEGRALAAEQVRESTFSLEEVVKLLRQDEADIIRSTSAGDLYALPFGADRELRYPSWQFVERRVVPELGKIIPAFPASTHPLSIQRFMVTSHEELGRQSPVQWLLGGRPASTVIALVDELGFE